MNSLNGQNMAYNAGYNEGYDDGLEQGFDAGLQKVRNILNLELSGIWDDPDKTFYIEELKAKFEQEFRIGLSER